jgi:hypothetical protein
MKTKYIRSEIKSLPNFQGSIEYQGGLNTPQYIWWFKLDDKGNYIGFEDDEALDLLNTIDANCSRNVINNSIQDIEEDEIPYVAFSLKRLTPCQYDLSKILKYQNIFNFEIIGYLPSNHKML